MSASPPISEGPSPRLLFRKAHRITLALDFQAAYKARISRTRGPLVIFGRLNGKPLARLGLTVSRKVGIAVVRNRIKRRLREAFRLGQLKLPAGVDLVVNVRPHLPLAMEEYQRLLIDAAGALAKELARRAKAEATASPFGAPSPGAPTPERRA